MNGQILVMSSFFIAALIIIAITLHLIRKSQNKKYRNQIKSLEVQRNLVVSTPVLLELSKVEPIIKNEKMEAKYTKWQEKFDQIKDHKVSEIDDMLIDLDVYVDKKDYKTCLYHFAKTEIEIYKAREAANHLLDEIKEITLSEEKYRAIVTKLKTKYRELNKTFQNHKNMYDEVADAISLQLENIEKKFLDFEKVMEKNEYDEVVHVVKALDVMIDHMGIVVEEVPDLVLMAKQVVPNRIQEVLNNKEEMTKQGYPLDYLNLDYNVTESKKTIEKILDNIKVLNLENGMFDLKTILEYYDSLFVDFEKERLSRHVFEEMNDDFNKNINKDNKIVKDIMEQLDDIKNMYDLKEEDIIAIKEINKTLIVINDDYKKLLSKVEAHATPYSLLHKEIEELANRLKSENISLDKTIEVLGNMYNDEVRAHEQLKEIENFLKQSKDKIRSYKLPIISDNYFVQLAEANEAIYEVIKELEKKPIVINTLNTRVDTARDLVLKLYNTTNEMIKTAELAEMAIVYGNRYRVYYPEVDSGLYDAEKDFFKGNYKLSLEKAVKTTQLVDENIYRKLLGVYDK